MIFGKITSALRFVWSLSTKKENKLFIAITTGMKEK